MNSLSFSQKIEFGVSYGLGGQLYGKDQKLMY